MPAQPAASHTGTATILFTDLVGSTTVRRRLAWAAMLLDRSPPGDAARAGEPIAAGLAEVETLGMAREIVQFPRLNARMASPRVE